jgi:hypothetical protein
MRVFIQDRAQTHGRYVLYFHEESTNLAHSHGGSRRYRSRVSEKRKNNKTEKLRRLGIEPRSPAWKAGILPLNQRRSFDEYTTRMNVTGVRRSHPKISPRSTKHCLRVLAISLFGTACSTIRSTPCSLHRRCFNASRVRWYSKSECVR